MPGNSIGVPSGIAWLLDHARARGSADRHGCRRRYRCGPLGTSACSERREHFLEVALRRPRGDRVVEHLVVLHAPVVVRERRIVREIGAADRVHQPLEDAVAVAGDDHVAAVVARIGAGRRDAGQDAPAALAHVAERRELRDQALHHAEHRLVQRDVDELALAAVDLDVVHREQRADHAVQRRRACRRC